MSWSQKRAQALKILDGALDLASDERQAHVDHACGGDEELKRHVLSMLDMSEDDSDPLATPVYDVNAPDPWLGTQVGAYHLIARLGQGGMGRVYLAEREDYGQKAALKLINPGLGFDAKLLQRFEEERRILARLDHPHIARILDGGTHEEGHPYYVMEYVEGRPIHRFCREENLDLKTRLRLFQKVCGAVQYAHRNLVVHRDLKPGNILVGTGGEPKLLDFGIAKSLEEKVGDEGLPTITGQGPMTPRYASPEQVQGEAINTSSDTYSLGVLLYELLTGESPYRLDSDATYAIQKAVCEQPAPRPSARLAQANSPHPSLGPAQHLRGDLDSILLRALQKDPDARYGSVRELAEDLERHLDGRPVRARADSWAYRLGKFVRRNWAGVGTIVAFLLMSTGFAIYANTQRIEIEDQEAITDSTLKFFKRTFKESGPDHQDGSAATLSEFLARGKELLSEDSDRPESERIDPKAAIEITGMLGGFFRDLGDLKSAEALISQSLEAAISTYSTPHEEIATRQQNLGVTLLDLEELEQSEQHFKAALEMKRALGQEEEKLNIASSNLAVSLFLQGSFEKALELLETTLRTRINAKGTKAHRVESSLHNLASLHLNSGNHQRGIPYAEQALKSLRSRSKGDSTAAATNLDTLGQLLMAEGNLEAAKGHLKESFRIREERLGAANRRTAYTKKNLVELQLASESQNLSQAEKCLEDSLEIFKKVNPDGWRAAEANSLMGELLMRQGKPEEAAPLLRSSYTKLKDLRGKNSWITQKAEKRLDSYLAWEASQTQENRGGPDTPAANP